MLYIVSYERLLVFPEHVCNVPYPNRAESDRTSMAKDLYERDHQLKQLILAVTKFAEILKVCGSL